MGEILGLGVTHGPMLAHLDKDQGNMLKRRLASPQLPDHLRDPANWPEPMRLEWADDDGEASAHEQRMRLLEDFRKCRRALDDFKPDAVLIWGDDQFENFHEDVIPPFCVHMAPEFEKQPWAQARGLGTAVNMWGEDADFTLKVKGHPQAAKHLVTSLMEQRIEIPYAYKQLHDPFPHAFWRTVLYLDADRAGWDYPVIPFHVNCIGNRVTGSRFGEPGQRSAGPRAGPVLRGWRRDRPRLQGRSLSGGAGRLLQLVPTRSSRRRTTTCSRMWRRTGSSMRTWWPAATTSGSA